MLKILLTDDNQIAINGLRLLLSKRKYDFEIYEASNGQLALDILRETPIDILVTDVDMPQVNGLELAERAQQLYPTIKIIFFSAYSDFAYAKQAIHLNAISYLLKPIQPAEFYEVLDRTVDLCEKTKEEGNEAWGLDVPADLLTKLDAELYLSDLFFRCEMDEDTTLPVFPAFANGAKVSMQFVFLRSNVPLFTSERKKINSLLKKISNVPVEFYAISGSYGIIALDLSQNRKVLLNWDLWWNAFKWEISQMNGDTIFLAIRTKVMSSMTDMIVEMKAIRRLLLLNNYIQRTTLIGTEHKDTDEVTFFQIDLIIEEMQEIISRQEYHLLSERLHNLISAVLFNHAYSFFYVKHLLLNIIQEIERQVSEDMLACVEKAKELFVMSSNLVQSEEILQEMLLGLEEAQNKKFSTANRYIQQIQSIILSNNFSNLDLQFLAEKVNLSVTYMCNLFKKETGISIGQYIKNVRMERAKELLRDTNLRLNDIYPKVGYSSLTYFCNTFKETFGITPTQFRQQETK